MNKKNVIIAGGSGFIGNSLAGLLVKKNYNPVILTRKLSTDSKYQQELWDGRHIGKWTRVLENSEAVINLAGRSVDCRFTPENKLQILNSRLYSTKIIGQAINEAKAPPRIWIQASSLGYYGDTGNNQCNENSPPGKDFLADVTTSWEEIFSSFELETTREVIFRIGFVLGNNGGAFPKLVKITKAFMGGRIGNGKQFISWIHISDLLNLFVHAIENDRFNGIFNACSPNPVTNDNFMRNLRKALNKPWAPPVPKIAVKVGSFFMNTSYELAVANSKCAPDNLTNLGYNFEITDIEKCFKSLLLDEFE